MKYVLFVCTHNAGQQPAHRVWPEVVEVMRSDGEVRACADSCDALATAQG